MERLEFCRDYLILLKFSKSILDIKFKVENTFSFRFEIEIFALPKTCYDFRLVVSKS